MGVQRVWCVIFVVVAACTCGARTECGDTAKMSFLTSVHDGPSCEKLSTKGVMLYEAARLFAEIHNNNNNNTDGHEIEITVLDTCGSISGAMKAVMKALVWADINCLRPPHYLGIIGPDTATSAEAVHKVTSILKVPHIVKKPSISPYLHPLAEESNSYIVQGVLKIVETLRWKSFALVVDVENDEDEDDDDDDDDDDVQNVAKKLTMSAAARGLCVTVHGNDEEEYAPRIVYLGRPETNFFGRAANATVLIASEGNLRDHLSRVNSTGTVLLLEDSRDAVEGLERKVESSRWRTSGTGRDVHYDAEELKEVKWLQAAVDVYAKTLRALCKSKKCKGEINPLDWNRLVSSVLARRNAESRAAARFLELHVRTKAGGLERLGGVIVREDKAKVYWGDSELLEEEEKEEEEEQEREESDKGAPRAIRNLLPNRDDDEPRTTGCAAAVKGIKMPREDTGTSRVLVSGMSDSEWWTMVGTVSGVGIAMFLLGILAVYVIYTNIRGPRCPKGKDRLDRDTSLRRVGSDRELPTAVTTRHPRLSRALQRTNSQRSDISEKSV